MSWREDASITKIRVIKFGMNGVTPAAQQDAITAPTGGATTDAEARAAINSIITVLETFGMVAEN